MLSLSFSSLIISCSTSLHLGSNSNNSIIRTRKIVRPPIQLLGSIKQTTTSIRASGLLSNNEHDEDSLVLISSLEKEILNFMNANSLTDFPTKRQLLDANRLDLVLAISNSSPGSWLSLGWDNNGDLSRSDDDDNDLQQQQMSTSKETSLVDAEEGDDIGGVHGILARLKKHRSISFDRHKKKGDHIQYAAVDTDTDKSAEQGTWTIPGKYFSDFQAAEIDYGKEERKDKPLAIHRDSQFQEKHEEINPNQIRSRLQHMQLELSSALCSLRSKSQTVNSEVHDSSAYELQQLSDVWEFQENELMKAEDKLRSIRAKLAVFEGKIALSVIDTQKLVEEKQRRIDSARRTLQLLRTTCIFWTHSASDVLLVGSFDGWTSQIKMEKTRTGIFSASLKLYPGRYEIKFIVDGIWRVNPMLPVVHSNGYENNSIVVRE